MSSVNLHKFTLTTTSLNPISRPHCRLLISPHPGGVGSGGARAFLRHTRLRRCRRHHHQKSVSTPPPTTPSVHHHVNRQSSLKCPQSPARLVPVALRVATGPSPKNGCRPSSRNTTATYPLPRQSQCWILQCVRDVTPGKVY